MQIFVDADACPVIGIVEKVAKEHSDPVTLLCDTNHVLSSEYSEVVVVGAGALFFYQREGFDIQCDNHGRMQPITKVTMKMHHAVREDLLRYLQSHITA